MDPWVPQPMDTSLETLERGRGLREAGRKGKEKPGASGKGQRRAVRVLSQGSPEDNKLMSLLGLSNYQLPSTCSVSQQLTLKSLSAFQLHAQLLPLHADPTKTPTSLPPSQALSIFLWTPSLQQTETAWA